MNHCCCERGSEGHKYYAVKMTLGANSSVPKWFRFNRHGSILQSFLLFLVRFMSVIKKMFFLKYCYERVNVIIFVLVRIILRGKNLFVLD